MKLTRRSCLALVTAMAAAGPTIEVPQALALDGGELLRYRGVDLGMLEEVEEKGGTFSDLAGHGVDAVDALASAGANLARLRLWVDPYTADGRPYGGGTNDLPRTIDLAKRVKARGMDILLDLHVSDWWADPGTQTKPKAWRNLSGDALVNAVRGYTRDVIEKMSSAGVCPQLVQMGNEISSGILWDDGRVGNGIDDFKGLADLLKAGFAGVAEGSPAGTEITRLLHLDMGGDRALYQWWFDGVTAQGVDFDVIGLSYYPFWHRSMGELKDNLNALVSRYDKDVLIVETAYGWTLEDGDGITDSFYTAEEATGGYPATVAGQTAYLRDLRDLLAAVPQGRGLGYVWWEPTWLPIPGAYWGTEAGKADNGDDGVLGNPWDNQTLFDFEGRLLSTATVLGESTPVNWIRNGSFEADGATTMPSRWGVWSGQSDRDAAFVAGPGVQGLYKLTHWKATDYLVSTYQVVSGLPSGSYRLEAWVLGSGGQTKAYMYAKRHGGGEVQASIPGSPAVWRRLEIRHIPVTSGTIEIGFFSEARGGQWINVDDVRLFVEQDASGV